MDEIKLLKVSSTSKPNSVAGAIAGMIRDKSKVQIQVIGAGALNQAIKGVAIARGFIAPTGQELGIVGDQLLRVKGVDALEHVVLDCQSGGHQDIVVIEIQVA